MPFALVAFSARNMLDPRSYTSLRTRTHVKKKERQRKMERWKPHPGPGSWVFGSEAYFVKRCGVHYCVSLANSDTNHTTNQPNPNPIMQTRCPLRAQHHSTRHRPRKLPSPTVTLIKLKLSSQPAPAPRSPWPRDRGTCASGVRLCPRRRLHVRQRSTPTSHPQRLTSNKIAS